MNIINPCCFLARRIFFSLFKSEFKRFGAERCENNQNYNFHFRKNPLSLLEDFFREIIFSVILIMYYCHEKAARNLLNSTQRFF